MPTTCWSSIRGEMMRVTKLDGCGRPVAGPKSSLLTDGFISLQFSPQYEDGEDTRQKSASGRLCIVDRAPSDFVRVDVEASLCGVNPDLWSMFTGQPIVLDAAGNATGVRIGGGRVTTNFALEVWSDIAGGGDCEGEGVQYGYFLLDCCSYGQVGDFTIEEAAANFTLTTSTKDSTGWGVGPYDVVRQLPVDPALVGVAGPLLEPMARRQHLHMDVVDIAPPVAALDDCGAVALTLSP